VNYLINSNAVIRTKCDEALRFSAVNGHLEIVRCLVENGANIHASGDYAIRDSAKNGHLHVVCYLDNGAAIHAI
jgi:ankyrin repeat protein